MAFFTKQNKNNRVTITLSRGCLLLLYVKVQDFDGDTQLKYIELFHSMFTLREMFKNTLFSFICHYLCYQLLHESLSHSFSNRTDI